MYVDKIVEKTVIQEVRVEVPILQTKVEIVKEFVDRIVVQEKYIENPKSAFDSDSITE